MAEFLQTPFGAGFTIGVITSLAAGFLIFRLKVWLNSIKSFFSPQVVTMTTQKSPFSVLMTAVLQTILLTAIALLILIAGYLYFFQ